MRLIGFVKASPFLFLTGCLVALSLGCERQPSPPLSPDEALASFRLADPDIRIELVAAEPLVQDPVAISFDAGGRLWVVEMLAFMKDIEGSDETDPIGRVSVLFDDDGDGQMDRSRIFLDSLVLPRALALVEEGILVSENIPLWFAEDRDGDFRADTKTLVDSTYGGIGMPEHSANGLWRGLDNWLYNAKSKYRYRNIRGEWVREETEFRGQWGMAHDDAGRLFYNYNWSQLHADLVPPNSLQKNEHHTPTSGIDHGLTLDRSIYPIRSNTAVNRGYVPGTLDETGRLLEFASACGPLVYRGDALPEAYKGDAFVCEPTANLIKQNNLFDDGFMLRAEAVYPDREFLASTDERFRPVSLAPGPDGALYIVDMYKGIIQHGPYMTDYLREVTLNRKLDKPIHMGRIWRVTRKDKAVATRPALETLEPEALLTMLESANGWTRDQAQRLLVEKGDLSVVDGLKAMITSGSSLGQLHALWTLEGLEVSDPAAYLPGLASEDPVVAQSALRLLAPMSETRPEVQDVLETFIDQEYEAAAPLLQMQMILTCDRISSDIALEKTRKFLERFGVLPVARDVALSSLEDREMILFKELLQDSSSESPNQQREIFMEMLATAVTNSGELSHIGQLLAMAEPDEAAIPEWLKSAIVHGMLNARADSGAIALSLKPRLFEEGSKAAQPLLAQLEARFSWPGKPVVAKADTIARFEIDATVLSNGRKQYLNLCASCHGTQGEGMNRFAPPLQQSEWVNGEAYKLVMILLHGMEGPVTVNGRKYNIPDILPSMPSFTTLQDEDIAAIATYIRNAWGHGNAPVSRRLVGGIRFRTQGKIQPWQASELDTLRFDADQ